MCRDVDNFISILFSRDMQNIKPAVICLFFSNSSLPLKKILLLITCVFVSLKKTKIVHYLEPKYAISTVKFQYS